MSFQELDRLNNLRASLIKQIESVDSMIKEVQLEISEQQKETSQQQKEIKSNKIEEIDNSSSKVAGCLSSDNIPKCTCDISDKCNRHTSVHFKNKGCYWCKYTDCSINYC